MSGERGVDRLEGWLWSRGEELQHTDRGGPGRLPGGGGGGGGGGGTSGTWSGTSTLSDTARSDGSQSIVWTETYVDENGNVETIRSTHDTTADGAVTETQDVTLTDAGGNVIASESTTTTGSASGGTAVDAGDKSAAEAADASPSTTQTASS